jgi:hypothetical protein
MIRNVDAWREWEEQYIASTPPNHAQALRLAEEMLEHARSLGVFPPADPLQGIEDTVDLAKALNVSVNPPATR